MTASEHAPASRPSAATRESISIPSGRSYLARQDDYPHPLCIWNYHPEWEIHFIPEGRGLAYVGDYVGSFDGNHLVLCGKNLPHNWISPGLVMPGRDYVLQFDADRLLHPDAMLAEFNVLQALVPLSERGIEIFGPPAREIGQMVMDLCHAPPAKGLGLFVEILERIHHTDSRRVLASARFVTTFAPISEKRRHRIDAAIQLVQSEPHLSMQEICTRIDLTEAFFSRSFKAVTGMNFSAYIRTVRIGRARTLLAETDLAVTEICYDSGFSNLSNFNRAFLLETGMTPRAYRKAALIRASSLPA